MILTMHIMIGLQASGKSSFVGSYLLVSSPGLYVVSKDLMPKSSKKSKLQETLIRERFSAGISIIIDNTNVSKESRYELISLAKEYSAQVIGYYMESTITACISRNKQRKGISKVPEVAIYSTFKKLQEPSIEEGFTSLYEVRFGNVSDFTIYRK